MRRIYILGLIGLAGIIIGFAWAEQVTLSTYYPAPYGVYKEFTTTSKTTLATNPQGTDTNARVGIGTTQPDYKLDVDGNMQIRGIRTYLTGIDGSNNHWIMVGGSTEGTDNALGFNPATKEIFAGSGWTIIGAGGFGGWESRDNNQTYEAATDGFVIARGNDWGANVVGYTGNQDPPPLRIETQSFESYYESITMPVKKGDYWRVTGANISVFWISMGG